MERTRRRISVIVPCYNCAATLAEAVESCFAQGVAGLEIVMVDDGSTDGTRAVMDSLAAKHPEIRILSHGKNRGGGAARNTGIRAAQGELLYCLDGDNVFAPGTLARAADFIEEKDVDGAAFYERRFFGEEGMERCSSQFNRLPDRAVALRDLFDEADILLDNFLYTKESYLRTSGYPEHHGFDTQTFEILYLAAGNRVMICPDTAFYHRQGQKGHKSYFEREYEKGLFSINTFLALEPALGLLHGSVIDLCATWDVLAKNRFGAGRSLLDALKRHARAGGLLLASEGPEPRSARAEALVACSKAFLDGRYAEAKALAAECARLYGSMTPLLSVMMVRIEVGQEGFEPRAIEHETADRLSRAGRLRKRAMSWSPSLASRIVSAIRSILRVS